MDDQHKIEEVKETKSSEAGKSEAEEYLSGWKRAQADLVNYRKDEVQRLKAAAGYAQEKVILDVLAAMDNIDVAIKHAPPDIPQDWYAGLVQAAKDIDKTLKKYGVERIPTLDKPFDPSLHEVLEMVAPQEGKESHTIVEEVRSGFTLHGKVIRPARVKIIN